MQPHPPDKEGWTKGVATHRLGTGMTRVTKTTVVTSLTRTTRMDGITRMTKIIGIR